MSYSDNYSIRTTSVTFNDVGDAIDGVITRNTAGTTTGTSTAYIASPSPAWTEYTNGAFLVITPHVSNGAGPVTINVSNLGAKDIKRAGVDLAAGVLVTGVPTILVFNGVHFEVLLQNLAIPVGTINPYAGAAAPSGWLLCDGAAVSRTTYASLFSVIGETFGVGDGSTTFNVPDLRRRAPLGKGTSDAIGDSDGLAEGSRTLTHNHSVPAHYHGMGTGADLNITNSGGTTTGNQSANHTHSGTTNSTSTNQFPAMANSVSGNTDRVMRARGDTGSNNFTVQTYFNHTHTFTTGANSANHTHSVPAHTHASGNFQGRIGLVTGGVDGNSAMTSGNATQPYLILNYIVRH